jgi:hypothetical protein
MRRTVLLTFLLAAALAAAGCGPVMLKTKGRLLKGGAPLTPAQGEIVRVMFVPVAEGKDPVKDYYVAQFDPADGTFQVVGKDGRGMPPGKYRVTVSLEGARNKNDRLGGAFDEDNTPFVREVTPSTPDLTLDLDNPKG